MSFRDEAKRRAEEPDTLTKQLKESDPLGENNLSPREMIVARILAGGDVDDPAATPDMGSRADVAETAREIVEALAEEERAQVRALIHGGLIGGGGGGAMGGFGRALASGSGGSV